MIADFQEIEDFARLNLNKAKAGASVIHFSAEKYAKSFHEHEVRASHIGNEPGFAELDTGYGMAAWAVVLSVDMRGSTARAMALGAKPTYLTMHTYLPTMAELVGRSGGKIVGLRGDGLFGAFGLTKREGTSRVVSSETAENAVQSATRCGKAMLEAVEEIVNPLLRDEGITREFEIGVGIDVGDTVITRIGITDANEITAYGPCVNEACKLCGKSNGILLTTAARNMYPTSKGGRMQFWQSGAGFHAKFPGDMVMLERSPNVIRKTKPK